MQEVGCLIERADWIIGNHLSKIGTVSMLSEVLFGTLALISVEQLDIGVLILANQKL